MCPLINIFRENYETHFNDIYKAIHSHDPVFDQETVLWCYILTVTRTWPGLYIPYIDLFNHSTQYGATIQNYSEYHQVVVSKAYHPGEQIYVSYGIKDVISLAYDFGFYDPSDVSIAIPFRLQYLANDSLQFGVAKRLIDKSLNASFDKNMNIVCSFKDSSSYNYEHFIGFSDHGISVDTFELFTVMSIQTFDELKAGYGTLDNTLLLLKNHINNMITSTATTGPLVIKENYSKAYNSLISAIRKRIIVLSNCLDWINKQ